MISRDEEEVDDRGDLRSAAPGGLSFFRDEQAVAAWRTQAEHRAAQEAGRAGIFAGYRLRVAAVVRDYGMSARADAPPDSRTCHG